jgi:ABC-type antimicrobial peptide transport system permease subunit
LTAAAAANALVIMAVLGVVAGLFPAWRASRLSPVQALKEH